MKLRARLGTITKVVVIEDDVAAFVQISEIRMLIQNAFGNLLFNQPFKMGLNKTEPFTDEDVTLKECGIVNCDLIFILTENPIPAADAKKIKIHEKKGESIKEKPKPECSKGAANQPFDPMAPTCISPYMNKVLFCHESTSDRVPERLEMLLHSSSAATPHEIVIVALHQLLMESGFQFATNVIFEDSSSPEVNPTSLDEIFTNQRSHSFYKLFYIHPDHAGVTAMLICIPMLKMLVIQGKLLNFPAPKENSPELIINSENFTTEMTTDSVASIYKNLRTLSAEFKDRISLRLLIEMKIALGIPDNSGFLGLFPEIQLKILKYLDFPSLLRVSLVCKSLYEKSRDSSLWRRMYMIHRTTPHNLNLGEDWFDNFKKLYTSLHLQDINRGYRRHIPSFYPSSLRA